MWPGGVGVEGRGGGDGWRRCNVLWPSACGWICSVWFRSPFFFAHAHPHVSPLCPFFAAFRGDPVMLPAARVEIRERFEEGRTASEASDVDRRISDANDAAEFIRGFVVQARPNERGNLELKLEPQHANKQAELIAPGMAMPKERRKKADDGGCCGGAGNK